MALQLDSTPSSVNSNITSADKANPTKFFIIGVLTIPVNIVGTLGSLMTLFLIIRQSNQQRSSTSSLMVNLCLATFVFCGTSSFYDAYTMITGSSGAAGNESSVCIMFAFLHFWWLSVSAHSHAAIAIHRLVAVVRVDRKHAGNKISSKILALILISYTWLVPLLVLVWPLFKMGGLYGFSDVAARCSVMIAYSMAYQIVLLVMNSFVPLTIMVACYIVIFFVIIKSRQKFNFEDCATKSQGARGVRLLRFKAEIRVTYIAFLTCAWFSICYIPASVHGLVASSISTMQSPLAQALVMMTWIGCATTPILYIILSTDMRSAAKKEFLRVVRRHSNSVHIHILGSRDDNLRDSKLNGVPPPIPVTTAILPPHSLGLHSLRL